MGIHLKSNRYLVREKIAQGGMGEVYSAYDTTLQRKVAVKKIRMSSLRIVCDKRREAQLLASLNHPNIVQVYDTFDLRDDHYIVTELIEGESLDSFLQTHQSSLSNRLTWLRDIASAVQYSHENNVIHGDIKLGNVMITFDGKIKLTDFGLGRLSDQDHINVKIGGSADYIAPETLLDKKINQNTDLFSLGVLAYKLICNTAPFGRNQSAQAKHLKTVEDTVIPIALFNQHVSKRLALLIENLLEIDPEKRNTQLQVLIDEVDSSLESKVDFNFSQTQLIDSEENITQVSSEGIAHRNVFRSGLPYLVLAFVLLLIISFQFFDFRFDKSNTNKALVLVLEPMTESDSSLPDELINQLKFTVLDSLQRSVDSSLELSNVYYPSRISPKELNKRLTFYGADEALLSKIKCKKRVCDFNLYRLNNDGKTVLKEKKWTGTIDSLTALSTMTRQMHASLYSELNFKNFESVINEADYHKYLELYEKLKIEKTDIKSSMQELENLILSSPKFLPLYHLYRESSLNLHHHSKDTTYLSGLRKHLELAEVYFPNSPEVLAHYFWLAISQHDFDEAENYLTRIRNLKTEYFLGLELGAYFYLEKGEYELANQAYELLTQAQPSRKNFYNFALSTWYSGDYAQALTILTKLLMIFPDDYSAQKLSATSHLTLGNIESAIELYEKIALRKPSASNFSNLGLSYLINQDAEKALNAFLSALEHDSKNVEALINIADAYKVTGQLSKSTENYSKALRVLQNRKDWRAEILKCQVLAQLGNFKEAIRLLQSLKLNRAPNAEIYYTSALVYALSGDMTSALVNVEKAIENNFGKVWFHLPWFKALCERRDFVLLVDLESHQKFCPLL